LIIQICLVVHDLVVHEILANKDFTVTDDLISQLFVVTFVHPTYMQIALIWGFTCQEVDLTFLISFSYFYFIFDLFFFILFLELGLGLE